MANVLLVYPAPARFKKRRFGFSLDLLYVSSLLKQAGHTVTGFLDFSVELYSTDSFIRRVEQSDVVILEFDSFPLKRSINLPQGEELIDEIYSRFTGASKKKIILYGSDVSLVNGEYPRMKEVFMLTKGREHHISEVVESLTGNKPFPAMHPLSDLDRLPFPDRQLLSGFAQHGGSLDSEPRLEKSTLVRTSLGCMNICVFCQRKGWYDKYMAHSIPYVLEEFSLLANDNYRNIWVIDDNFTHDLKRSKELLKELGGAGLTVGMKLALSSWTRIDEEFLDLAKNANVSIISFGIESANKKIQKFYRKPVNLKRFGGLIDYADQIGLYTVGNVIIGAPMETAETMNETFSYIMDTPFDQANIKILDYMAGSLLFEKLPLETKQGEKLNRDRHMFACKENGLNDFPLNVLKSKIIDFTRKFRKSREARVKEKIDRYGPPYFIKFFSDSTR